MCACACVSPVGYCLAWQTKAAAAERKDDDDDDDDDDDKEKYEPNSTTNV